MNKKSEEKQTKWRFLNVDSILGELNLTEINSIASTIDFSVASLAFKNFDFIEKRLSFVFECSTNEPFLWLLLIDGADRRYWIRDKNEGIVVYNPTEYCGYIRTYRFNIDHLARNQKHNRQWTTLRSEKAFYNVLDTPSAQNIFKAWEYWMNHSTQHASELADGRIKSTVVNQSLIFTSSTMRCIACTKPAVTYANTTVSLDATTATLIQIPVCLNHLEAAQAEPNILTFLANLFSLSLDLPSLVRSESIPDSMIPAIHELIANKLAGSVGSVEKRDRGWLLKIELCKDWYWLLRLNSLTDYAYMLFKIGNKKEFYRADSAPDHPELPFFPDHEHSKPNRKNDTTTQSFLYGMPIFDLKRLFDITEKYIAD